jgi:hypothetical protein
MNVMTNVVTGTKRHRKNFISQFIKVLIASERFDQYKIDLNVFKTMVRLQSVSEVYLLMNSLPVTEFILHFVGLLIDMDVVLTTTKCGNSNNGSDRPATFL